MSAAALKNRSIIRPQFRKERLEIQFISNLPAAYRESLEHLLFFNPQQARRLRKIAEVIEATGVPKILQEGEHLRILIDSNQECQAIFALARQGDNELLVGVVIFVRHQEDRLLILHLAVDELFTMHGANAAELLTFRLIDHVRRFGSHMKGIRFVELVYGRAAGQTISLPVKK